VQNSVIHLPTLHAWKLANRDETSLHRSKGQDGPKLLGPSESGCCIVGDR